MGRLTYTMNVSLDGYVETPDHSLDWAPVDEELHTWFNDRSRSIEVSLLGRHMYEVMRYWSTAESDPAATPAMLEFAQIWNPKPKVVFSMTLESVPPPFRLVRGDVVDILADLRREFDGDLDVGGPTLAREFISLGLVNDYGLVVHPVVLGGGTPYWPRLAGPFHVRLAETHRFASGAIYLGYRRD